MSGAVPSLTDGIGLNFLSSIYSFYCKIFGSLVVSPVSADAMNQKLREAAANPKQAIHLRADKTATYEKVSHILAAAQKYGLTNIGFVTEPSGTSSAN